MAAGALVRILRARGQAQVCILQHVRAGRAVQLRWDADVRDREMARQRPPREEQVAGLGPVKRHRLRRPDRAAQHAPRRAVDARWDVRAHDRQPARVDPADQRRMDALNRARQSRAEQRVDDRRRARQRAGILRRQQRDAQRPAQPRVDRRIARKRLRRRRAHAYGLAARLAPQPRRGVSVSAVPARAACKRHARILRHMSQQRLHDGLRRVFHQQQRRIARALHERPLHRPHVRGKNRPSHVIPPQPPWPPPCRPRARSKGASSVHPTRPGAPPPHP